MLTISQRLRIYPQRIPCQISSILILKYVINLHKVLLAAISQSVDVIINGTSIVTYVD